ncbi:MAG: hypothetical protein V1659_03285 [Candidatus Woesearchaeota archaeon]
MKPAKIIIPVFLLLLCAIPVLGFDVFLTPVDVNIHLGEFATFEVFVQNSGNTDDYIQVFTADPNWIVLSPNGITVPANSSVKENLTIMPKSDVLIGPHGIIMNFRSSRTGKLRQTTEMVNLLPISPFGTGYIPNVVLGADFSERADPRDKFSIDVLLRNKNNQELKNITLRVYSELFGEEHLIDLGSLEEKTITLVFDINDIETPGVYNLYIWVLSEGITVTELKESFEVIGYSDIEGSVEEQDSFFKTKDIITFVNNGNDKASKQYKRVANFIVRLFQKSDPKPEIVSEDGRHYAVWSFELGSLESVSITVEENYRVLFYIGVAIVAILIAYYIFRSPVVLSKRAELLSRSDGGHSDIKVYIHARNRSGMKINMLKISDRISVIAQLVEDKHVGSVGPSKVIKHSARGTLLRWDVSHMEPYEERIITYKIRTKLGIVGGIVFKPAVVRFETAKGKERVAKSNSYNLKI